VNRIEGLRVETWVTEGSVHRQYFGKNPKPVMIFYVPVPLPQVSVDHIHEVLARWGSLRLHLAFMGLNLKLSDMCFLSGTTVSTYNGWKHSYRLADTSILAYDHFLVFDALSKEFHVRVLPVGNILMQKKIDTKP
jgi:hypothetical protein